MERNLRLIEFAANETPLTDTRFTGNGVAPGHASRACFRAGNGRKHVRQRADSSVVGEMHIVSNCVYIARRRAVPPSAIPVCDGRTTGTESSPGLPRAA